jgi:4-azaleucine resistance transporter AzlC
VTGPDPSVPGRRRFRAAEPGPAPPQERDGGSRLRDGARAIAPLSIAAAAFGLSFGVLAESAGMGTIPPILMSATTFAGSAQFAAASILDDGGGVAAAVTAAVLLNLRYAPISISVARGFRGSLPRRLLESQLIVDESWAVSHRGGGYFDHRVLLGAGLLLYPCWVGGTALGALGGELVGDPNDLGLDAAFPALFLALLYPLLRTRATVAAAVAGAAVAIALTPVAPAGVPIVAAAAVSLAGWRSS